MVLFEQVGLSYGDTAPDVLSDLTFTIDKGGFRWLLGRSGAGKSSLLRLMSLAAQPSRGRVSVLGYDIDAIRRRSLPRLRRRIGVVFQDLRLLPQLSAYDNVALPLRIAGRSRRQIRRDVPDVLRWVGVAEKRESRPQELSGGEQQRVAIARAVIGRPKLLLADEPTSAQDEAHTERVMRLLNELARLGVTVVVATHNERLVARHPAPALCLERGRLVRDG